MTSMERGATLAAEQPVSHAQEERAGARMATPLLLLAAALLAILVIYLDAAWSMVRIWIASETFAHGWVIAPISLWLAWLQRRTLAQTDLRPWYPALAAVAMGGVGWLLGEIASVNLGVQLGLVLMLQFSVVVILGWRAGKVLAFPLAFLFFAVPFGDFMVPTLMDWTADVTVTALRLTGVPVYREGNFFSIPTGQWSVVEACSGLRYLIAAVMAGTLYAYLTYRSLGRRLAFIAASFVIPILANWVRAYIIVMLGHLSGNKLAAGVDHLIYGWVFFGIVIFVMFWVGSRWREDHAPTAGSATFPTQTKSIRTGPSVAAFVSAALLAVAIAGVWKLIDSGVEARAHRDAPALAAIQGADGWTAIDEPITAWRPHFVGASAELHQGFAKDGQQVGLVVAYYRNQTQDRELINFHNTLAPEKDPQWRAISQPADQIAWAGTDLKARAAEVRGNGQILATRRFYWIDGRYTSSDTIAKVMLAFAKLFGGTDDSAIVVVFTPSEPGSDQAEKTLRRFAADMSPAVARSLSATKER